MIRFIHTADIHFGMENYGRIDQQTGIHTRLLDFNKALTACIDYALEQKVDFFLFAGDAYKTINPSPTQQRLLFKCFLRLQQAGIPIVMVIGNHDNPLSFGKANTLDLLQDLPLEGFYVITKPTSFVLKTKSGPIQIVGIPWPTKTTIAVSEQHAFKSAHELVDYISQATGTIISHFAQQLDQQIPAVLMGHLTVTSGIFSGSEKRAIYGTDPLFLPSQLAIEPFDYVALGHLHRFQNLNPNAYPPIIYSGSIERIDFGERNEDKGFCDVTIHEKGKTSYHFIKTPMRPFIQIEVTIKNDEPITQQIIRAIDQHEIQDAIVKILYHVPAGMKDSIDLQAIARACSSAMDLVGVIPIYQSSIRDRRTLVAVKEDLESLLDAYFSAKPELQNKKDILIEKTLALKTTLSEQELNEQ